MNPDFQLLIALLAAVAVGLWIYGDATDRKLPTALYWAACGFLFGLLGFLVYFLLVIRPNKKGIDKPKS